MEKKSQRNFSIALKTLYTFNDYEITDEKAIQIIKLIIEVKPNITDKELTEFIDKIHKGVYGILYRQPTCILFMFQKYIAENRRMMP